MWGSSLSARCISKHVVQENCTRKRLCLGDWTGQRDLTLVGPLGTGAKGSDHSWSHMEESWTPWKPCFSWQGITGNGCSVAGEKLGIMVWKAYVSDSTGIVPHVASGANKWEARAEGCNFKNSSIRGPRRSWGTKTSDNCISWHCGLFSAPGWIIAHHGFRPFLYYNFVLTSFATWCCRVPHQHEWSTPPNTDAGGAMWFALVNGMGAGVT